MKEEYRVAVIGCGVIAHAHLDALKKEEACRVIALCDIDQAKAEALRSAYAEHAAIYTDYRVMLTEARPHAVHICTPHYLHAEMTIAALQAGIHVFLEKPACISEGEIFAISQAERESDAKLCISFQNRFTPEFAIMERLVKAAGGAAALRGMVTWNRNAAYYRSAQWRGKKATEGGGLLINQAIHTLDLLLCLGGEAEAVTATVANYHLKGEIDVEDSCNLLLSFRNGGKGLFFGSNAYTTDAPCFLEAECKNGDRITMMQNHIYRNGEPVCIPKEVLTPIGKACYGVGHAYLIPAFYHALREGSEMPVPLASAAKVLHVILAAYRSDGHEISL